MRSAEGRESTLEPLAKEWLERSREPHEFSVACVDGEPCAEVCHVQETKARQGVDAF